LFPDVQVASIADVGHRGEVLQIAAFEPSETGKLVLLRTGHGPRLLGDGVVFARFSQDANRLLFESRKHAHVGGGVMTVISETRVYDIATDEVILLDGLAQPRWEADGRHVRATRLRSQITERAGRIGVRWLSARVRVDVSTRTESVLGTGDAQLPAPVGREVAWSSSPERPALPASLSGDRCRLSVGNDAPREHAVEGPFCLGVAEERSVRWSGDGQWLAFASFEPDARSAGSSGSPAFLQIVSSRGQPHPAVEAFKRRKPQEFDGSFPGFPWIDWAPSNRSLVVEDARGTVTIYELEKHALASVGPGTAPTWSPGGGYLLLLTDENAGQSPSREAFIVGSQSPHERTSLGRVRDARWFVRDSC
jgi:hypothetical protein